MFLDARELQPDAVLRADVCLVGAGPAGLTIARELARRGHDVLLLESGGLEHDCPTQDLAEGEQTGDWFQPLHETRARRFGGTAHFWNSGAGHGQLGFRVGPLSSIDFERRKWLPHSVGWPFGREALDPYYARVHRLIGLERDAYEGERWLRDGETCLPLDADAFESSVWQFGVTETFTCDSKDWVRESAGRIRVALWSNVLALDTDETGRRVTAVRAACLDGKRFRAEARLVVLAAGGIENARLLLLSTSDAHPAGLANAHGLVGRHFMEHQYVRAGRFVPADRSLFARAALYDTRPYGARLAMGKLDIAADVLRRERLLNVSAAFVPQHRRAHRANYEAMHAFYALAGQLRRGRVPDDAGALLRTVVRHGDFVVASAARRLTRGRLFRHFVPSPNLIAGDSWSGLPEQERRWDWFDVILHTEQAPDPENRVTLSTRRDALGLPLPHLAWRWRDVDVDAVRRAETLLARGLARAGLGHLHVLERDGRPFLQYPGLHHHMGTTRMHADPRLGVVDEHARAHGVDNLFVAGCSVFPSGGYINPTLTILALATRLADRLATVLDAPAPTVAQLAGAAGD